MKKIFLYCFLILGFISCDGLKQQDPVVYNDIIVDQIDTVGKRFSAMIDGLIEGNTDGLETKRMRAIEACDSAITKIKNLGPYKKDETFQSAAIQYVTTCKKLLETKYKEVIDIQNKILGELIGDDNDPAYEKYDELINYCDSVDKVEFDIFHKVQVNFAQKNDLLLKPEIKKD